MKHFLSTLLIFTAILPSIFLPNVTQAQSIDAGDIAGASGDCIAVGLSTWLAGEAQAAAQLSFGAANAVVSVPISSLLIENATASTQANAYVEPWYTCAAYAAGQLILKQLTDETINWINGGFNGSPSYSIDTHKLFTDLTDMVAGTLARDIRNLNACDFEVNYKNDLANWVDTSGNDRAKFPEKIQCPFQDKFNFTASELYGDFQKGGWRFFESTLTDSGNPFGVAVMTANELTRAQEEEIRIQEQRLSWGGGFLEIIDENNCVYPEGITKEIVDEMVATSPAAAASYKKSYCAVATPGKLIESKLTQTLGVKMDRLKLADNMSAIIGALINKLSDDAIKSVFKNR